MPLESISFYNEKMFNQTLRFITVGNLGKCCDIGEGNAKMEFIKSVLNIEVDQLDLPDFNFDRFNPELYCQYDTVFCLEVIEHLQNPLFFMRELRSLIKPGGVIYLSTPGRPRIIWNKHHFFEMDPSHFNKWILAPLNLKIIRKAKVRISRPWYKYIGFRPLLRLFTNYTNIYEITNE